MKYYVSPNGSDQNPGTVEQPFRTVQQAINRTAGDGRTIFLRGGNYDISQGTYQTEKGSSGIHIEGGWNDGTADSPLVIRSYPGERAVLDGSNVAPGITGIFIKDAQNVEIKDIELHSLRSNGILAIKGQNLNFSGNRIHHNQRGGIVVQGYGGEGQIDTSHRSQNIRLEGNRVYRNYLANSNPGPGNNWGMGINVENTDNVLIVNNTVYENYGEGIGLGFVQNGTVSENTVHDNFSVEVHLYNTTDSTVKRNLIYNTGNQEFFRDGRPANGIEMANELFATTGKLSQLQLNNNTVRNNVVVGSGAGFSYGTYAGIHSGADENKQGLKNTKIANNTFYDPRIFLHIDEDPNTENVTITNNIFSRPERFEWLTNIDSTAGLSFSENLWHGGTRFGGDAGATGVASPDDLRADPMLANPGGFNTEDYQLLARSPATRVDYDVLAAEAEAVPTPSSILGWGLGLVMLVRVIRRKRRS
ncbi:MAG: right-handed parallel beta-helix repeat-containing protein [Cyanophyceae cyanobacterium]